MVHDPNWDLFALLSASLFGASTPFAKLLLGSVGPSAMAGHFI
jgi:uncharacterized membrane protein